MQTRQKCVHNKYKLLLTPLPGLVTQSLNNMHIELFSKTQNMLIELLHIEWR